MPRTIEPQPRHKCEPPGLRPNAFPQGYRYRVGTTWDCECGRVWIVRQIFGGSNGYRGGYSPGGRKWDRAGWFESRRHRRLAERIAAPLDIDDPRPDHVGPRPPRSTR